MSKKILYALLSLVVAFGLWLYVITVENPNSESTFYGITVVLDNESVLNDRGLMILSDKVPTVTLKLGGNRNYLNKLSSSNIILVADLSRIYEDGEQSLTYTVQYPGDIPQNSIEILSQLPAQVSLTIAERLTQSIPVNVVYDGQVPEGYISDPNNVVLETKVVNATGPASVVKQIAEARVMVDLDDQTETIAQTYTYAFYDKNGNVVEHDMLTADVSEIKLSLQIQPYKEVPLKLEVIPGGGATEENSSVEMDMETVLIAGEQSLLDRIDSLLVDRIDLGTMTEDTELSYDIADLLPAGVTNVSAADQIHVTVQFPELKMQTFTVSRFLPQNVPEGMQVDILTNELSVTLRGPVSAMRKISAGQIQALVDFSSAEPGKTTYAVTILVPNVEDVGAVYNYTVTVKVSQVEAETEE